MALLSPVASLPFALSKGRGKMPLSGRPVASGLAFRRASTPISRNTARTLHGARLAVGRWAADYWTIAQRDPSPAVARVRGDFSQPAIYAEPAMRMPVSGAVVNILEVFTVLLCPQCGGGCGGADPLARWIPTAYHARPRDRLVGSGRRGCRAIARGRRDRCRCRSRARAAAGACVAVRVLPCMCCRACVAVRVLPRARHRW